ncbi:MAG: hypothetical protein RJB13_2495 [Pseudomonadota bacterium]
MNIWRQLSKYQLTHLIVRWLDRVFLSVEFQGLIVWTNLKRELNTNTVSHLIARKLA